MGFGWKDITQKTKGDVYKKMNTTTGVCLIHKHFDKARSTCPHCNRPLDWFGGKVAKVKKGNKKGWKKFILAYSQAIWSKHNDTYPSKKVSDLYHAWRGDPAKWEEYAKARDEWVLEFDKFLRTLE